MKKLQRVALALAAVGAILGTTGCMSTPDAGTTQVIRNGGPMDNRNIKTIIHNGEGKSWIGWMSSARSYPTSDSQRTYTFGDVEGADAPAIQVPSKDGVQMELNGSFLLTTSFDGTEKGDELLKRFDTAYGNRKFLDKDVYDLEGGGWNKWLSVIVKPVIDASVRETVAEFNCRQLVSSCSLVQDADVSKVNIEEARTNGKSNTTIIQDRLTQKVASDINDKLRAPYFRDIKFSLGAVKPDEAVQRAISSAQASKAESQKAQIRVATAKAEADANRERQKGYNDCAICGKIDAIKALPKGLTALGGDYAIGIK